MRRVPHQHLRSILHRSGRSRSPRKNRIAIWTRLLSGGRRNRRSRICIFQHHCTDLRMLSVDAIYDSLSRRFQISRCSPPDEVSRLTNSSLGPTHFLSPGHCSEPPLFITNKCGDRYGHPISHARQCCRPQFGSALGQAGSRGLSP